MSKIDRTQKDSFWDIEKLVPRKKQSAVNPSKPRVPHLAEVHLDGSKSVSEETSFKTMTPNPRENVNSYSYQKLSSLIRSVQVTDWKNSYHYYEFFCKNAMYFRDKRGERCERVPFFSYVAQYSQMSREQLAWYLWWRDNAKTGKYLDTDVSYILLYYYEVINLGDALDTKEALDDMIGIWAHYRDVYPQLDSSVAEWICDYSLIHRLPIPFPHPLITRDMIGRCSLREVYYSFDPSDYVLYAKFLLTYCNAYNYRRSKFYTEETAPLYDEHIVNALAALLKEKREVLLDGHCHLRKTSRVAFTGALCSYRMRKKLEVEYISLSDTEELRETITGVIKYCENKLRSHLDIRSRLGVRELDPEVLTVLDEYFGKAGLATERAHGREVLPEYEKLYEVRDTVFSIDKAIQIERSSWNMTALLVDEFEQNESIETETKEETEIMSFEDSGDASSMTLFMRSISEYAEFFEYVLLGNADQQLEYCRAHGLLPDAVVDEINEKAVEYFEDILIEEASDGYSVIEDYRSMFEREGDQL